MNTKFILYVNLFMFLLLTIAIEYGLFYRNNYVSKNDYTPDIFCVSTINEKNVLSLQDMSTISGGCSGGTCTNNEHTCPSDCTHHNADKCSGSSGNCVNFNWSLLCDCPSYYDFDEGC